MSHVVETRYGRLAGARERGVLVFRGIPFARAPLGERRFRRPEPVETWDGVREARAFAPAAPQNPPRLPELYAGDPPECSEDCLYLNVSTPGLQGAPRPVLVWVHAGDLTEGSASKPGLTGRALARRGDVVVVTIQYRLGALGFLDPGSGSALGPANLGLLDQIAALEWVRDEIDAFGGDPSNVTVFGSSTGAGSIAALLTVPQASNLVRRAILQSAALDVWTRDEAARVTTSLLEELGLVRDDIERLRSVPIGELLAAQLRCERRLRPRVSGPLFRPVVDGELLTLPPIEGICGGAARGVPMIVGTNLDEARVEGVEDPALFRIDEAALLHHLQQILPGAASRALETYTRARQGAGSLAAPDLYFAVESDRRFRHPATRLAAGQSHHEARTYAYLFTWPSPAARGAMGAFHGLEVPFVFGTRRHHVLHPYVAGGDQAKELSHRMSDAWIAFARCGDPSSPALGHWRPYTPTDRHTMVFGEKVELVPAPLETERRFWDEV